MNSSSEAAEQIVRLSLEGFEVAAKISGKGFEAVAALLVASLKGKNKTAGKTKLKKLLKSGKELKVFTIKKEDLEKFTALAKKYGVVYSVLIDKKNIANDGLVDIMVKSEDAARINRIVERFKMADYNEAEIRSEVTKQKDKTVNPHSAETVKSPQFEPSSTTQKSSQGTNFKKKPSVKNKLEKAKAEVRNRDKIVKEKIVGKEKKVTKGKVK